MGLKIKCGKFYMNRIGQKVRIYAVDGANRCTVHGAALVQGEGWKINTWDATGKYNPNHNRQCEDDIVCEWPPMQFDWSKAAVWHNWIAMDEAGTWWLFTNRPKKRSPGSRSWCDGKLELSSMVPDELAPKEFEGHWEDSLFARPPSQH